MDRDARESSLVIESDSSQRPVPRIEALRVRNFRALRDVQVKDLTPLTVILGPNGSGKSTLVDVFAFLAECFGLGLRQAWERRGRFRQLRTRGSSGTIAVEVRYRERPKAPVITYHLEIDETPRGPVVSREWMRWTRGRGGKPFNFLNYARGEGQVISGELPEIEDRRISEQLTGPDVLAVSTLGQLAAHPRVRALREFIVGWHLSYLSANAPRGNPEAGAQERLSQSGDNLPNVIQFLHEQHPDRLERIFQALRHRVPQLERFEFQSTPDGRLLLLLKDAPFVEPILARYASDGTLKLLAYLVLLYDPTPPPMIGIEEPENYLHPRILPQLAEECAMATARAQLLVTTHSPFFIQHLEPGQVRVIYRDRKDGCSLVRRVADMPGIAEMTAAGGNLGDLWTEGHFDVGDPLSF
jgi:predicted ATPase